MAEAALEEVLIAREQGRLLKPVQQSQNVVVPDTQARYVLSDDTAADAPGSEQVSLVQRDVFVQQVHAALGRRAKPPSSSSRASRASCTASVTAALQIFPPPHRYRMKSHDNP